MKSCSSTSGFRRLGRGYAAAFFALVFAFFALANEALLHAYARVEGRVFGRAWTQKKDAYAARAAERPWRVAYVGDSTVDVGARMDLIDPDGFNLGRSGMDPSRLPGVARWLLSAPELRPRVVLLTFEPSHLGEDAYAEPLALPFADALSDAARLYYAQSGSFKPLLCGGCGYLTSLADLGLARIETALPAETSFAPPPDASAAAPKLYARAASFRLVEDFRRRLADARVRVLWVDLPMRSGFRRALADSPTSRDFALYEGGRLAAIFGPDRVDLSGFLDDRLLIDDVHASPEGAEALSRELGRRLASLGAESGAPVAEPASIKVR
jgi:hypothetical protein